MYYIPHFEHPEYSQGPQDSPGHYSSPDIISFQWFQLGSPVMETPPMYWVASHLIGL